MLYRPHSYASLLCALLLCACTVGPDYQGPPQAAPIAEKSPAFHRATLSNADNSPPATRWWEALQDPELNRLITAALEQSPNIKAAQARLRQARAGLREQQRNALPTVSASAVYLHAQVPSLGAATGQGGGTETSSTDLDFYNAGFDATWELDLFGGTRRAIEAAKAQAQVSEADLEDLHVSLAAEVAQAYVGLRSQQQRLVLSRQSADLESKMLALTQQRRARGAASDADIERLRTQLETTQGTLIPLRGQFEASLDQLAVLTGREPGALDDELTVSAPIPSLPAKVNVGDPASMLRRRPDIREAERNLAAANAQIGKQVANLFPKITLLGDIGWGSTDIGHLFDGRSFTPIAAPILQWNVLDFGRTHAKISQAEAGRDEAAAKYEAAVLSALQDAETSLSRFGRQRENIVSLERIAASADRSAALTHQRNEVGAASVIDVLDAERTRLNAEQNLSAGQAELVADYASLQKSLGLGWSDPVVNVAASH